jgi:hypothetical protein
MTACSKSLLLVAVLIAACDQPTGVSKSPPEELAFARSGGVTSALLPSLGGASSVAYAINDVAVAVGSSTDLTGTSYAVRWTPTASGWTVAAIAGAGSRAVAINVNGAAVGLRDGRGKLWPAGGGEIDLGAGVPSGINSAETVVGVRNPNPLSEASERAVVWRKPISGWNLSTVNASQDLPSLPGGTGEISANAINDAGVIAGVAGVSTATSAYYAVRWDPAGDGWTDPAALPGTASFSSTTARAITDNPQPDFAGHVRTCQEFCSAFGIFWPNGGSPTNLEPFFGGGSGWVQGLNNAQRAVGFRFDPRHGDRAFVWSPGQTSIQLLRGPSGYSTTQAYDINNRTPAQAVGSGYGPNPSRTRAIVWTIP